MASHLLGVLQPAVVFRVNGDAGCSPGVTSDGGEKARRFWPASGSQLPSHFRIEWIGLEIVAILLWLSSRLVRPVFRPALGSLD
jgi:hypothetical protein